MFCVKNRVFIVKDGFLEQHGHHVKLHGLYRVFYFV